MAGTDMRHAEVVPCRRQLTRRTSPTRDRGTIVPDSPLTPCQPDVITLDELKLTESCKFDEELQDRSHQRADDTFLLAQKWLKGTRHKVTMICQWLSLYEYMTKTVLDWLQDFAVIGLMITSLSEHQEGSLPPLLKLLQVDSLNMNETDASVCDSCDAADDLITAAHRLSPSSMWPAPAYTNHNMVDRWFKADIRVAKLIVCP